MDGRAVAVRSRYASNVSNDKSSIGGEKKKEEKKKSEEHFACLHGRKLNCVGTFRKKSAVFELLAHCTVFHSWYPGLKTTAFRMSSSRFYVSSVS